MKILVKRAGKNHLIKVDNKYQSLLDPNLPRYYKDRDEQLRDELIERFGTSEMFWVYDETGQTFLGVEFI